MNAIHRFNSLSPAEAAARLRDCCGSSEWVSRMSARRPIAGDTEFFGLAEEVFDLLGTADWLEAFASHPAIGGGREVAAQSSSASQWSRQEQSAMLDSSDLIRDDLASANVEYARRFGFTFIVCATGKSPEEMIASLRSRIDNDREIEIRIAAAEQRRITRLRIEKLLNELSAG